MRQLDGQQARNVCYDVSGLRWGLRLLDQPIFATCFLGLKETNINDMYGYLWTYDITYMRYICWLFISNYFFSRKKRTIKRKRHNEKKWTDQLMILLKKEAESLQLMHQHLVDAGGANLDFEPMDRNWAIKPKKRQLPVSWEDRFPLKKLVAYISWFFLVEMSDKLLGKHVEVLILSISAIFLYSDVEKIAVCGSSFEFDNHGCYPRFPSFYFLNWQKSVLVDWHGS